MCSPKYRRTGRMARLVARALDLRPPRLVLGWMTIFGWAGTTRVLFYQTTQAKSASCTLRGTGNEYRPKFDDAVRLQGVKAGWFVPIVGKRVGGR